MAWLTFSPGETKTVRLVDGSVRERRVHWIDRRAHDCVGGDCAFCKAGTSPKTTYPVDTECNGQTAVWEMTGGTYKQFLGLLPDPAHRPGTVLRVTRNGTGPDTRYQVDLAGSTSAPVLGVPVGAFTAEDFRQMVREELMSEHFLAILQIVVGDATRDAFHEEAEPEGE